MSKELDTLKELRQYVDDKINALSKPKLNTGWLKLTGYKVFCYTTDFKSGYGISHDFKWTNKMFMDDLNYWEQATPSEVEEALKKEAFKRGLVDGATIDKTSFKDYDCDSKKWKLKGTTYVFKNNKLLLAESNDYVFYEGIWADIVKEPKTIDEWADEFQQFLHDKNDYGGRSFKTFITKHNFKLPE